MSLLSTHPSPRVRKWGLAVIAILIILLQQFTVLRDCFGPDLTQIEKRTIEDEPFFTEMALNMAYFRKLNPHWFSHPATTQIYPLVLVYHFILKDNTLTPAQIEAEVHENSDSLKKKGLQFNVPIRSVGYTYFLLCALAIFFLVWNEVGLFPALAVTLLVTSDSLHTHYSPMLRNDGPSIFFTTLLILAIFSARRSLDWKKHSLIGIALGAAIATKYYLFFGAITYLGVLFELNRHEVKQEALFKLLGIVAASTLLGLFLFHPFLFLEPLNVLKDMKSQAQHFDSRYHQHLSFLTQCGFFLKTLFYNKTILFLFLVGFCGFIFKKNWVALAAGVSAVVFLTMISSSPAYFHRWTLPLKPIIALYCGQGIKMLLQSMLAIRKFLKSLKYEKEAWDRVVRVDDSV